MPGPSGRAPAAGASAIYRVEIAGAPATFECAADDTLLRAGLRAGLGMPYECNVGSCGTCKVELASGRVEAAWPEAPGLTERDRARKRVLACQSRPTADCVIKVRLADQYQSLHKPRRFSAALTETRDITHDIREFRFHNAEPVGFLPGQYALLSLPGVAGLRAYSMSNIATGGGTWEFLIKRVPDGKGTAALFDRMAIGDPITIDGPFGLAYLRTQSPRDIVCIAGGSGLSPVISIARGVAAEPALASRKLHLFYGGRGPRDVCGEDMLRALPGFGERFFYYPVISMPELDVDRTWRGRVGLVHEIAAETLGSAIRDYELYFAGPPPMVQAVQLMLLQQHQVPHEQIHFDQFF